MAGTAGPEALRRLVDATINVAVDLDLRAVLRRVLDAAVDLSDARYGALGVLDPSGKGCADLLTVGMSDEQIAEIGIHPQGLGVLGHVIEAGAPTRLPVVAEHPSSVGFPPGHPPMQSFLGVPIRVRDQVFGLLYLTEKETAEVFSDVDEDLVVKLAKAAGVAIEHARLFEKIASHERVIEALNSIAGLLLLGRPRDEVLNAVAQSAREVVGAALSSIVLPDGNGGMYVPAADGRLAEAYRGRSIPSTRLSERVAHVRTPGTVDDLSADPTVGRFIEDLGPTMYVPVNLDGEPYGCMVVIRVKGDYPFNEQDIDLLGRFASQAAIVLDYDRRRRREAELVIAADQFRIAEHLQDSALQEIFAASLRLSGAAVVAESEETQERIHDAIEGLDRAIRLTRKAIFDLKSRSDSVS